MEDLGIDGNIIVRWKLKEESVRVWTGFVSLRIGTSGGLL
jgi:hypothetical protein